MKSLFPDPAQNRSILSLLLTMVKADDEIAQREMQYIQHIAEQMNISPEELSQLHKDSKWADITAPESEGERMRILYLLLFTMRADGVIAEEEIAFTKTMGLRLGIRPALCDDLISIVTKYRSGEIPETAMLDQVKKYLN